MKTYHTLTAIFIAFLILETFYPLGDFVSFWFGTFGTICGYIFALVGVCATAVTVDKFNN